MRCPDHIEIKKSAKAMAWCWSVKDVLEDKNFYLRLVMQYGGQHHLKVANKHFTKADFIEAIENAPPGFFWSSVWHSWRNKLGLPKKAMPIRFPELRKMPEDWWRGPGYSREFESE